MQKALDLLAYSINCIKEAIFCLDIKCRCQKSQFICMFLAGQYFFLNRRVIF